MGRYWVAVRKRRRSASRKRREARLKAGAWAGVAVLALLLTFWSAIWPYLVGLLLLGAVGGGTWWLWRTDRLVRGSDRRWRHEDAVNVGHRTLAEVDLMDGTQFEGESVTVLADGAYINTGLVVPHRKRQGRALLPGEEEDNAEHRKVRARVEHAFARMKHYKILRDCRQRGNGLHHAVQAVAHMHNLTLAA
ncbi:transposase family protein [Streptomyces sp. NPDC056501]|uniref:transposase family protein n=1 Tax=Streptomyces sp. NPDC056501 TaxID=3345841 RepID=UPI0036C12C31